MSSSDKRPFDLRSPVRGLTLAALPLSFAAPGAASAPAPADGFADITGRCAPASVGQFGPGAMPRLRDERVIYTVPCQAGFRSAVLALAKKRGVDAAELVRMVLTLVAPAVRAAVPDPGVPGADDREASMRPPGPGRRMVPALVPTLVLRLDPDLDHPTIRQALAVALALDDPKGHRLVRQDEHARLTTSVERLEYRNRALANAVDRLSFRPRSGRLGLRDAALMLGFASEHDFDEHLVTKRFRELAPIFHPDTGILPCRERMAQLIDARNLLIKHLRTIPAAGTDPGRRQRDG
ncbi:MAG: hypothetical protein WCO00_04035 [Rhodospirillaceae bacterium]